MEISRLDLNIIKSLLFKEGENKYNKVIKDLASDESEEDLIAIRLAAVDRDYNPIEKRKNVYILDVRNSSNDKKYIKFRKYISHSLLKNEVTYKESEFLAVLDWNNLNLTQIEENSEIITSDIDKYLYDLEGYKVFYSMEYLKANAPL